MDSSEKANQGYADWARDLESKNEARAKERARLAAKLQPLAKAVNEVFEQSRAARAAFLDADATCRASTSEPRVQGLREILDVVKRVSAQYGGFDSAGPLRLFFWPEKLLGTPYERPMISFGYTFLDPKYDEESFFRHPNLPPVPKTKWEKFVHFIDIDALPATEDHRINIRFDLMGPLRPEQRAALSRETPWTEEELLMMGSNFDYLRDEKVPTRAEYVDRRIGVTCKKILGEITGI